MRKILVLAWLLLLFAGMGLLFWLNDWKYNQPTPVPENYHAVLKGSLIRLAVLKNKAPNRPVFIHFFNPDCPCSRFNMPQFASLVKKYNKQVDFLVVLLTIDKKYTPVYIQQKYNLTIPVLLDTSIAKTCGVYSSPQAVIIDKSSRLFYRGNYNKSRYCTDSKTNFAQIALDDLLTDQLHNIFTEAAFISYGCQLPRCKK